ncbi:MAG: glycosyltransferase family 2 protein [Gemmataceae bacterium]|nr:glycosyltransferase family 2 protein [Gemmataceae bacterium]
MKLTLVIPAFNEVRRLPPYLESVREYADGAWAAGGYAVIVVDDGSTDGLREALAEWIHSWPELHVVRHGSNGGKGAALRTGALTAQGDVILLADGDGATPIEEQAKLRRAIEAGADIAIGSRRLMAEGIERSWSRNLTGACFAWVVRRMFGLTIRDTQCGFKMFRRDVAQRLFAMCREDGFLIDVEFLLHAQRLGYQIAEAPVAWRDVPGSKVRLVRDGWRMLTGLWRLRRRFGRRVEPRISPIPRMAAGITTASLQCKSVKSV